MTPLFIDTGAFYARYVPRDAHHAETRAAWPRLQRRRLFTTDLVLVETVTLLDRRAGAGPAATAGRELYGSPSLSVVSPTIEQQVAALDLLEQYSDQRVGFADCVSFVVMREMGIKEVFAFDRHFAAAGFTLWPKA